MAVKIIAYHDKYKEQTIDFILDIQRNEFGLPVTIEAQADLTDIDKHYVRGGGIFLLAIDTEKDTVVGTFALVNAGNGVGALKKVFVARQYRGKALHIADDFFARTVAFARKQKFLRIYLGSSAKFVSGHKFYLKHGFVEITQEELPENFPLMDIDDKFFCYEIDKS